MHDHCCSSRSRTDALRNEICVACLSCGRASYVVAEFSFRAPCRSALSLSLGLIQLTDPQASTTRETREIRSLQVRNSLLPDWNVSVPIRAEERAPMQIDISCRMAAPLSQVDQTPQLFANFVSAKDIWVQSKIDPRDIVRYLANLERCRSGSCLSGRPGFPSRPDMTERGRALGMGV